MKKSKKNQASIRILSRGVTIEKASNSDEWYIYHTQRTGPWSWTPKHKLAGPFKNEKDAIPEAVSLNKQAPIPWDGPVNENPLAFETVNLIAGLILAAGAATVVGTMAASGSAGPTGSTGATGSTGSTGTTGSTGATGGGSSGGFHGGGSGGFGGGNGTQGGGATSQAVVDPPGDEWIQLPVNVNGGEVLSPGKEYLISVDASVSGKTFQSYLTQFGALGSIVGSWDVGQTLPNNWPTQDSGTNRWRYYLQMENTSTILDASTETVYALAYWQFVTLQILGLNAAVGTFTTQPGLSYRFSVPPPQPGAVTMALSSVLRNDFSLDSTYPPGSQLPTDWPSSDTTSANTRYQMTCTDSSPTTVTIPKSILVFDQVFV